MDGDSERLYQLSLIPSPLRIVKITPENIRHVALDVINLMLLKSAEYAIQSNDILIS